MKFLFRSVPGRLILAFGGTFLVLFLVGRVTELPAFLDVVRRVVAILSLACAAWLAVPVLMRHRRELLWRVRHKLILSYVFLGAIPLVLVAVFVLAGGVLLYTTVVSYVFAEGYAVVADDVRQVAETTAIEVGRRPSETREAIERKVESLTTTYPQISLAVVTVPPGEGRRSGAAWPVLTAGPWEHGSPPASLPPWVVSANGFVGTLASPTGALPPGDQLVIRAVVPTRDGQRMVVADLPVDQAIVDRLRDRTSARMGIVTSSGCGGSSSALHIDRGLFQGADAYMDCTHWERGTTGVVTVGLSAPLNELSTRLAAVRSSELAATVGDSWWTVVLQFLVMLAVLFLIVQAAAVVMGGFLVRSITSALDELFVGTDRVRQGDFAHRIRIESQDQLGDLAESFNRMSRSIGNLLVVQQDKQRLDEELRIARRIQQSLLPERPPAIAGLDVADLCQPAREVGGDYYDFFDLGPRTLGVLVADVSGKGTSAALYMSVLKGLMLALSRAHASPRDLLVDVNRRLAEHLDNRSFITMTYAIIDMERRSLRVARAGHTPPIIVSAGEPEFIAPDGMVVGLRLPGAETRFETMLTEYERPLHAGDVLVLYTDGITEAIDRAGELFGELALARTMTAHRAASAAGVRDAVVREVSAFVDGGEPHDDMTMVVVKVTPDGA